MVMNNLGQKLSKQTHAPALNPDRANESLVLSMRILGLNPPGNMHESPEKEILDWGISHWNVHSVPKKPVEPKFDA